MAELLFILCIFFVLFIFYKILKPSKNRLYVFIGIIFLVIFQVLLSLFIYKEAEISLPPKILVFGILPSFFIMIYLGKILKPHLASISLKDLVAVNIVRFPVEIVLYLLFLEKKIPQIMTFRGFNYDILIGVFAIILLALMKKSNQNHRKIVFFWNVFSFVFLSSILVIAILSSVTPIQKFGFEQPNIALMKFPFILLPVLVVPILFLCNYLIFLKIWKE